MKKITREQAIQYTGWHTFCVRSYYSSPDSIPPEFVVDDDSWEQTSDRKTKDGYTYGVRATCFTKGFKNVASKIYYSLWRKKIEK